MQPWFTPKLAEIKKIRKQLERKWLKTKSNVYRDQFKYHRMLFQQTSRKEKVRHYSDAVLECKGNFKDLFSLVNNLTDNMPHNPLPDDCVGSERANKMADFFVSK